MSASEPLPQALKVPEVSRFLNRANQIRSIKPAITYWCEYRAVNQIVTRNLHTSDDECFAFTKALIERLEATKADRADDDAIMDNTAGQAYVEQFAQETFDRAERAMRANKVTRQTADTFDAAATFFDLTHEWGTPEPEILKKIKFAKWNAARILKAIREGRDPNETNPVLEERPETLLEDLAVQPSETPLGARAASVEDVPDAGEPPSVTVPEGYFPSLSATTHVADSFAPSPLSQSSDLSGPGKPPPLAQVSPVQSPDVQASLPPAPQAIQQSPTRVVTSPSISAAPLPTTWATIPTVSPPPGPATVTQTAVPARQIVSPVANGRRPDFVPDLKQAQRHARFAVSALDFDDVQAAIEQLREALNKLGAQ